MGPGNDNNGDIIPTLLRTYVPSIACTLINSIYSCIMPQQQRDDSLGQQEEGRIQQGCYPWDDEYSDDEDDEGDSSTGINRGLTGERCCEKGSGTIGECKG